MEQSISDSISGFQIIKSPLQEYFANSFPTYYPGDTIDAFVAAGKGNLQIGQSPTPLVDRQAGHLFKVGLNSPNHTGAFSDFLGRPAKIPNAFTIR